MSGLVLQTADLDLANDSLGDGGLLVEFRRKFRIMEKVQRHLQNRLNRP
jgi:hypothetical protein